MAPKVVKHRDYSKGDRFITIWKEANKRFGFALHRVIPEREAWIDREIASREWADGFGRLWRYVGMHETERTRS